MFIFYRFLSQTVLFFILPLLLISCSTQQGDLASDLLASQTFPSSQRLSATPEESSKLYQYQNALSLPQEIKLLSEVVLTVSDDKPERFRAAIVAKKSGDLTIQILPMTSLIVLQQIDVNASGKVDFREGENGEKAPGEVVDSMELSKKKLRLIFGELLSALELYPFFIGKIPDTRLYSEFYKKEGVFSKSTTGELYYVSKRLKMSFDDVYLRSLELKEIFQDKKVLNLSLENYVKHAGYSIPNKLNFFFPKRSIKLSIKHRTVKII